VLYVVDELSYDKYNTKAERIYRLDADIYFNNTRVYGGGIAEAPGQDAEDRLSQVEQMVRTNYAGDVMVKKGSNFIQDHHLVYADSTFFQVFTLPMVAGNPATALNETAFHRHRRERRKAVFQQYGYCRQDAGAGE